MSKRTYKFNFLLRKPSIHFQELCYQISERFIQQQNDVCTKQQNDLPNNKITYPATECIIFEDTSFMLLNKAPAPFTTFPSITDPPPPGCTASTSKVKIQF